MTRRMYLPACAVALAPVLLVSTMVAKADSSYPTKGMRSAQVERTFGHPRLKSAPSGLPPITHWVYDSFTVYFDHDRVIFHIKNSASSAHAATVAAAKTRLPKGKLKNAHGKLPVTVAAIPVPAPVTLAPAVATTSATVAAAPVAAEPAAAAVVSAPVAAPATANLAALLDSEKNRAPEPHGPARPVEKKPVASAPPPSSEPVVKPVSSMQLMRAGLVRIFQEEKAWYVGGAFGTSNYSSLATAECNGALVHNGFANGSCGKATGDSAYKVYGGYNFDPLVAVEGSIVQLGESSFATSFNQTNGFAKSDTVGISGKVSSRIINADFVLNLHPGKGDKTTLGVKLGAYTAFNNITSSATGSAVDARDNIAHSFSSSNSYLGLDARYKLFGGLAAEVEWNRFRGLGLANQTSSRDVDAFLAGLQYTF